MADILSCVLLKSMTLVYFGTSSFQPRPDQWYSSSFTTKGLDLLWDSAFREFQLSISSFPRSIFVHGILDLEPRVHLKSMALYKVVVITEISSTHGDKNSTSSNSNEVIHVPELISQHSKKGKTI